ncbi:MAG TPA: site-specific DNA-methyltransferase [Chloroflexota bacterium]|nr:site-specific DNA-methyltransferase [Chloroflexota bacterium]HUM68415.1 site-specific DNA-methyltransferase [Chloroflexota bacterium]
MNTQLIQGDCLEVMRTFDANSVNLVYLDPPFFTQKSHRLFTRDRQQEFSFDDLWSSHKEYARFLIDRLGEIERVLHPSGAIFFHCDRNASHIIRLLLDEVFGSDKFRSEIIWHYRRWSNSQRNLLPAHQTIYHYTKSEEYVFNSLYEAYSVSTNVDQILQRRKRDEYGKSVYDLDENGDFIPGGPKKGVPLSDVWYIPYLNPKAKERSGYPTQKPLLLLERIITIASNEHDLILDPFCGSGTTLVAAKRLNRRVIGIDVAPDAIEISHQRLAELTKSESELLKLGQEAYRNADEESLALLRGLEFVPVQRNKGIDAFLKDDLNGCVIPIRVQRLDETILEAANKLYQAAKTKHVPVMFLVALREGGYFSFAEELPPKIIVIDGPSLTISRIVSELRTVQGGGAR